MPENETATETIDRMVADPTLDKFFDNNPRTFTDADFRSFIAGQRAARAVQVLKKEAKKEKEQEE